jgi:hypothetical protein
VKTYAVAGNGWIKIGRSEQLPKRVRAIRNGVPFKTTLIGAVDEDIEQDTIAELRRAGMHVRGEWFLDALPTRRVLRLRGFFDR